MTDIKPDIKTQVTPLDALKLLVAVALIVFGVGEFYYYGSHPLIWGGETHQISTAVRLLVLLAALGVAVVAARFTGIGASSWRYLISARAEVQRMVWPSRQQTIQTTIVVIVLVVILGVGLWLVDLASATLLGTITGIGH
ncbi:MAG: preprotein translocase subunit SecE [Gammaproteobacteria bacterium]